MKEQLYTIPLMDAYRADEECPFCFIRRELEQHAMDFTLGAGASYMEDDIRAKTDREGFCADHYRQMFAYGNRLGSALILETHLKKMHAELKERIDHFSAGAKAPRILPFRKKTGEGSENNVTAWIREQGKTCFICDQIRTNYERYLATFMELFKKSEPEFLELVRNAKGYCLPHFADLLDCAGASLSAKDLDRLTPILFPQMDQSLTRIIGDVKWFQKKFDYRFKDADWKESRDAVQRGMQKAAGGYPADAPYKQD